MVDLSETRFRIGPRPASVAPYLFATLILFSVAAVALLQGGLGPLVIGLAAVGTCGLLGAAHLRRRQARLGSLRIDDNAATGVARLHFDDGSGVPWNVMNWRLLGQGQRPAELSMSFNGRRNLVILETQLADDVSLDSVFVTIQRARNKQAG